MNIDLIAGARPNFVKIAALIHANREMGKLINFRLIHTGQHYDQKLSGSFFEQLDIPTPDINLKVGSGSQGEQTAAIMIGYEKTLLQNKPDLCVVVGDVTSSMACAITAKKMGVKVAHVEAGIRSEDWNMPEEINRVLVDSIADFFFTTSSTASQNLILQGVGEEKIFLVGNTMIDTLKRFERKFKKPTLWNKYGLKRKEYFILTLHRPSNVDTPEKLVQIINHIIAQTRNLPVVFPVHPRTKKKLNTGAISSSNLIVTAPLGYLEFNFLLKNSKGILTDSGGITEEATVLQIPCVTLRNNTERPETVSMGTNRLVGNSPEKISEAFRDIFEYKWPKGETPEFWDNKVGARIVNILKGL